MTKELKTQYAEIATKLNVNLEDLLKSVGEKVCPINPTEALLCMVVRGKLQVRQVSKSAQVSKMQEGRKPKKV